MASPSSSHSVAARLWADGDGLTVTAGDVVLADAFIDGVMSVRASVSIPAG